MSFAEDWERCSPWLAAALGDDPTHSMDDVRRLIECGSGQHQFWAGKRSAIVTEIVVSPRRWSLHFWLAGGDLEEILEMKPLIEAWGKAAGCSRVTISGRIGWERVLKDYRRVCVVLSKEI